MQEAYIDTCNMDSDIDAAIFRSIQFVFLKTLDSGQQIFHEECFEHCFEQDGWTDDEKTQLNCFFCFFLYLPSRICIPILFLFDAKSSTVNSDFQFNGDSDSDMLPTCWSY